MNNRIVYGVGITDYEGIKYINENGVSREIKSYSMWRSMLQRCYGSRKYETYENVYVDEKWHRFSNFKKWFDENYYTIENRRMSLDKDIFGKGKKVYSEETCIIVPDFINALFTNKQKSNKTGCIGVSVCSRDKNKFKAYIKKNGKSVNLGTFNTIEQAHKTYCEARNYYIKEIANKHKDNIPKKLYDKMMSYDEFKNNNINNELADQLAKKAIGIGV